MVSSRTQLLASLLLLLSFTFPLSAQNSHVDGNVPEQTHFHQYLERDLRAYFQADSLEYELLRNGPTQVGVSLPKYYLWVRAKDKTGKVTAEGACRVAAIEKKLFEVLQFLDKESISRNPEQVKTIFPAPLVPIILERSH